MTKAALIKTDSVVEKTQNYATERKSLKTDMHINGPLWQMDFCQRYKGKWGKIAFSTNGAGTIWIFRCKRYELQCIPRT